MTNILGGAGGGGTPSVVSDNMRSQDSVEFILGVCEGPIAGLVEGPKSFFLNDTPLVSATGHSNFEAFELHAYHGDSTPTRIVPKLGGSATNVQVGVPLAQSVPVVRTTPQSVQGVVDRLEVRMVVNQLVRVTSDGDQLEATARFKIRYKKSTSAAWLNFTGTSANLNLAIETRTRDSDGDIRTQNSSKTAISHAADIEETTGQIYLILELTNGVVGSFTFAGKVYTRRRVGTYSTFYWNPETELYRLEKNANWDSAPQGTFDSYTLTQGTSTGTGYTLTFNVVNAGSGVTEIRGKTGSAYVKEYVRKIPDADEGYSGDWDIEVEKLNPDNDEEYFVSLTWESFQCVSTDTKLQFANLACVRGFGPASNQFTSLPTFSGIYAGKLVRVPTNYNPITRVYTGAWDGTFVWGYTDNPAWCLYDLIIDEKYGFKFHYPQLLVDRWSFYEASQWCDVLVPRTGSTGFQPRYTYNDLFDQPRSAMEAAQYIASIFGGIITTDLNGTIRLKLDKPGNPVQIFGPESVTIEGFQYQFADIASRANDFTVTFINPDLKWSQDVRRVSVASYITANGRIPMDFVAVGCIDPHEAQRRALLRLIAANTEVTTVTFSTTRPGILLEPFDIIGITDPYMNWGLSGRIKSVSGGVITLRDSLFLTGGATYTLTVQGKNGPVDVTVENTGGAISKQLTITSGTLPSMPANAQFALTSTGVGLVKPFRILSITESEQGPDVYTITAVEVNVNKYSDADQLDITPEPSVRYAFENSLTPKTPVGILCRSGTDHLFLSSDGRVTSRILVSWDQDPTSFVETYEVYFKRIDRDSFSKITVNTNEAYISNVQDGITYQIYLRAVNNIGNKSPSSPTLSHVVQGKSVPPRAPQNLTASQLLSDVRLDWDDITDLDLNFYEIRTGGTSWETATRLATTKSSVYTHANVKGSNIVYRVKSVDTSGNYSIGFVTLNYSVQVPGAPEITVQLLGPSYLVTITPPSNLAVPIAEYVIKLNGEEIFRGAATTYSARVNWLGTRTFSVQAVNTAGVVSPAVTSTLTITAPAAPAASGIFTDTAYVLSWDEPTASLPIDGYIITWEQPGSIDPVLINNLKATSYSIATTWIGARTFSVRAVDTAGNLGAKSLITATVVAPLVVNLQSALFKSQLNLSWSGERGTLPIKQYYVYTAGLQVAAVDAQNWSVLVDWNGSRTYGIRAEDMNGNLSPVLQVVETVDAPEAPVVTNMIVDKSIRLDWTEPTSELVISNYQIWRDGIRVQTVAATTALVPIDYAGTKTYQVRAVDIAGNAGAFGSTTRTINAPSGMVLNATITGTRVFLNWNRPTSTLPVQEYILMRGGSNTVITRVSALSYSFEADFVGIETFGIQAVDVAGNLSAIFSDTLEIVASSAPTVRPEILDNNVLLRWTNGSGTLPIAASEIRRGPTYATADILQKVDATFAPFFEFQAGTYTYWVVNIDSAGNYGTPAQVTAVVSEPQDFVLQADFNSAMGGTRTRTHLDGGKLYFGVDQNETYEQHFTKVLNSTIQDQINDGFPYWIQPNTTPSSYQEEFDYGAILSSSIITITPTLETIFGNGTIEVDIEARATTADPWILLGTAVTQAYAINFRFLRFTLRMVNDTRDDICIVSRINVKLNSKLRNDSGNGFANAADVGGTTVLFNYPFVDVQSISVTPLSTTARFAVYDFLDVPYPTSFKVLMFNQSGNRVSGNFSWSCRGF